MTREEQEARIKSKFRELEQLQRDIGGSIRAALEGTGTGFALLVFDWGPDGTMTYSSNAARPDMIRALEELLENLHNDTPGVVRCEECGRWNYHLQTCSRRPT